jgi:hypothetical protein
LKAGSLTEKFPRLLEATPRLSPDDNTYVVRPDGYVGLTTGADDWDEVEEYLKNWNREAATSAFVTSRQHRYGIGIQSNAGTQQA